MTLNRQVFLGCMVAALALGGLAVQRAIASGHRDGVSGPSKAAPPVEICGTTLANSPSGLADLRFWDPASNPGVASTSVPVIVRLTKGCGEGGTLTAQPAENVRIERQAKAGDGEAVAVRLRFLRPGKVLLTASRGSVHLGELSVRVT